MEEIKDYTISELEEKWVNAFYNKNLQRIDDFRYSEWKSKIERIEVIENWKTTISDVHESWFVLVEIYNCKKRKINMYILENIL